VRIGTLQPTSDLPVKKIPWAANITLSAHGTILRRLALLGLKEKQEKVIKEREVIVKEVVKIRCSYCRKLYDESLGKCPNCGASR